MKPFPLLCLLANDRQAKVETISPSRHCVMLGQPRKSPYILPGFLSHLPKVSHHD